MNVLLVGAAARLSGVGADPGSPISHRAISCQKNRAKTDVYSSVLALRENGRVRTRCLLPGLGHWRISQVVVIGGFPGRGGFWGRLGLLVTFTGFWRRAARGVSVEVALAGWRGQGIELAGGR